MVFVNGGNHKFNLIMYSLLIIKKSSFYFKNKIRLL